MKKQLVTQEQLNWIIRSFKQEYWTKKKKPVIDRNNCLSILNSNLYNGARFTKNDNNRKVLRVSNAAHIRNHINFYNEIRDINGLRTSRAWVGGWRCKGEGKGSMNYLIRNAKYLSEILIAFPSFENYYD